MRNCNFIKKIKLWNDIETIKALLIRHEINVNIIHRINSIIFEKTVLIKKWKLLKLNFYFIFPKMIICGKFIKIFFGIT